MGPQLPVTPDAVRPFLVFEVVAGSRAFGLATAESDEDRRGVFLPPAAWHWGLEKPPEQVESTGEDIEVVYWEIEKFVRLALKANPNILEVLWSKDVRIADETGKALLALRPAFLSKAVADTYGRYVDGQFARLRRRVAAGEPYRPKHAMHLLRLLLAGAHLLRHGEVLVDVGEHRDELLTVRAGDLPFAAVEARAEELQRELTAAAAATRLPDLPDYEAANRFLIAARRRRVSEPPA